MNRRIVILIAIFTGSLIFTSGISIFILYKRAVTSTKIELTDLIDHHRTETSVLYQQGKSKEDIIRFFKTTQIKYHFHQNEFIIADSCISSSSQPLLIDCFKKTCFWDYIALSQLTIAKAHPSEVIFKRIKNSHNSWLYAACVFLPETNWYMIAQLPVDAVNFQFWFAVLISVVLSALLTLLAIWHLVTIAKFDLKSTIFSVESFRHLFDKSELSMLLIHPQTGMIVNANTNATHFYGYEHTRLITMNISDLSLAPEHEIQRNLNRVLSKEETHFFRKHKLFNGEIREVEVSASAIKIKGETLAFCIINDITDLKETEAINKMLKHSLDVYTDGIYWMDSNNVFIYVNEAGAKACGYTPNELLGKTVFDVNPIISPESQAILWHELRTKGFFTIETVHRNTNGSDFFVEVRAAYFKYEGKEYNCGFARDITERKQVEQMINEINEQLETKNGLYKNLNEELRMAKEKAEENDRLKTAFLNNISHEVRTPLNAICGFSAVLKKDFLNDEKVYSYVSHIENSGYSLLKMFEDIMDASSIEARSIILHKEKVRIKALLLKLISKYNSQLLLNDKKLVEIIIEENPLWTALILKTDQKRLYQVFDNLLSNAVKYTLKGTISIGCSANSDLITFSVADTGVGIPEGEKASVFDSLSHGENLVISLHKGAGVGLTIANRLVEMMGGTLSFQSEQGTGSVFEISFSASMLVP